MKRNKEIGLFTKPSKMKYKIEYINPENCFIIKTDGKMSGDDFIAMAERLLNHPDYQPGRNILFDHRKLNFENTTIYDIEKIRNFHRENENKIGNGKSAIVVESQSEWDRIWNQGKKIKTENIVEIFDNFNNAMNWINE